MRKKNELKMATHFNRNQSSKTTRTKTNVEWNSVKIRFEYRFKGVRNSNHTYTNTRVQK